MTFQEFRYIRHGQPIPEGWELVADFDNCHHGRYSQGIIRKIEPKEDGEDDGTAQQGSG